MTPEEAAESKGRYCKVPGGYGYYYGQVADIDLSGKFALFRRFGRFKDKWIAIEQVQLHPIPDEDKA